MSDELQPAEAGLGGSIPAYSLTAAISNPNPTAEISGFWRRIVALFVDGLLIGCLGLLLGVLFHDFFSELGGWGRLLGFLISLPYFAILNSSIGGGQTLGKRLLGIKVVDARGQTISIGRSAARYAVLDVPYFLNGAMIGAAVTQRWVTFVLGLLVFGIGGAIVYLYIFNRKTRQSLHDVVTGTYVVRAPVGGDVVAPAMWVGHKVVVGVWLAAIVAFVLFVVPMLSRKGPFPDLLAVHFRLMETRKIHTAELTVPLWSAEQPSLDIQVIWKGKTGDPEKAADEMVRIVVETYSNFDKLQSMRITVVQGYDIGIASSWISMHFHDSPQEWRQRLQQMNMPPAIGKS